MTREEINYVLERVTDNELLNIFHRYADANSDCVRIMYNSPEFMNEIFEGEEPADIIKVVTANKDYNYYDKYVRYNPDCCMYSGRLESSQYIRDLVSISDIADWLEINDDRYFESVAEDYFDDSDDEE